MLKAMIVVAGWEEMAWKAETTPERVLGTLLDVGRKYPFSAGSTSSNP